MANTVTDLNKRIETIETILKELGRFKAGTPERLAYIKENIGDAGNYLEDELIFLRVVRRDLKIYPNVKYQNRSPRKTRYIDGRVMRIKKKDKV